MALFLLILLFCCFYSFLGQVNQADLNLIESTTRATIDSVLTKPGVANADGQSKPLLPNLVRLAFHDCVGGCDGCINNGNADNNGLSFGIDILEPVYQANFAAKMSRADYWALVGRVAFLYGTELTNPPNANNYKPVIPLQCGRVDCPSGGPYYGQTNQFPDARGNTQATLAFFNITFGLDHRGATAILGAHTLGRAIQANSGFFGPWVEHPDLSDNDFYKDLLRADFGWATIGPFGWRPQTPPEPAGTLMLNADMSLVKQFNVIGGVADCSYNLCPPAVTVPIVQEFANDNEQWLDEFAVAWTQMVSTGYDNVPNCIVGVGGDDPEYRSLDGLHFEYNGRCSYIVSTNRCDKKLRARYPQFEVITHHAPSRNRGSQRTFIKKVSVNIWANKTVKEPIHIELKSKNTFTINGKEHSVPYETTLFKFHKIESEYRNTVSKYKRLHFLAYFGLDIKWTSDDGGKFDIFVPRKRWRKICGLLGNNNYNVLDDLQTRNGTTLSYKFPLDQDLITQMGDSWMVSTPNQPLRCSLYPYNSYASESICTFEKKSVQRACENMIDTQLKKLKGVNVAQCFSSKEFNAIDETRIFEDCVAEICSCKDHSNKCVPHVAIKEFEETCLEKDVIFPNIVWKM